MVGSPTRARCQHAEVANAITFLADEMVHLDPTDSCWVSLKRFAIDSDPSDRDLLAALVEHPQYHDHYAGQPVVQQTHHSLHGPYCLDAISADSFIRADPARAEQRLRAWADDPEPSLPETHDRLARLVYPELQTQPLYELPALGPAAEHEWAGVVGGGGFHEFIAIDRARSELTLIVASDD